MITSPRCFLIGSRSSAHVTGQFLVLKGYGDCLMFLDLIYFTPAIEYFQFDTLSRHNSTRFLFNSECLYLTHVCRYDAVFSWFCIHDDYQE